VIIGGKRAVYFIVGVVAPVRSISQSRPTERQDVDYLWIFPDGSLDDRKNPGAIKVGYGQHEALLVMSDAISEESLVQSIQIDHRPIPKKPKKPASSNYTLDIKDMPQDIGGGFVIEESTP
jgi:hypothetical protein